MASGLARCGADLALLDIKPKEEIDRAVGDIFEATGKAPLSVSVDVRDKEAVKEAMKTVHDAFGQLDILVANAGIMGHLERPEDMSSDNWANVFRTNVDGVFNSATAVGFGMQAAYCATKGALIPLAKSLALAWAADGVQVNCLAPGAVNTPFTDPVLGSREKVEYILSRIPAGRLGVPEDFVGPCVFLASHASDYITGSTLVIDGGGLSVPMLGVNPTEIGKK
ncbi:hypothetical protein N2152v2_003206 [Parachlorella kessleri]